MQRGMRTSVSDFDPVKLDAWNAELTGLEGGVLVRDVPRIVASELRRQFAAFDDPSQYHLILRAQELEQL